MSNPDPPNSEYFDYRRVAREAGVSDADLGEIEAAVRTEYPGDRMMAELRLLRTMRAIRDRFATVADALLEARRSDAA
ncbi:MAG: hypothetical protein KDA05_06875 [Phycisphaerales bacterium]|nr:hypothetical protein [Phycisphaerales bacterium]